MAKPTAAQIAQAFLACRDQIEASEAAHKERIAPLKASLERLKTALLDTLNEAGVQNMKIAGVGTMFKKKVVSASCTDWAASLAFIQEFERWDFLEHRMNKTVVMEYMEKNQAPPPGVNVTVTYDATVQRGE
jgi:hypothetical protein